jgi:serine/threonine-protein kinase
VEQVLAGRYELEVPLGRGGPGEVWRGLDTGTRRPVAVKIVKLAQIDDPALLSETIARFRREAMVIAGLRHPNIVGSLDAGRIGSQLFMIMELAPGVSLAALMDERGERGMGLFPVASVLRIAQQVCGGLAAAHAAGVVHRDIKPSNLMVTPQLGIKIIDFGIARLLADNSPWLTKRGHTVGTVAYMSPEQAQGEEVDGRADLYALGCVLYQLLSGRLPFRSALPSALLMMQVMDQAIPLSALRPDLPPALTELVSDLMEKDRATRPADAGEVIGRLAALAGEHVPEEPQHEADRQPVLPGEPAETRQQEVMPAPGRPAGRVSERPAPPPGRETAGMPPWELDESPAAPFRDPRAHPVATAAWEPSPAPAWEAPPAAAWEAPPAAWDSAPGPGWEAPLSVPTNTDRAAGGGAAGWPPPPRRRQRRWRGALSTLLTVAVAGGVWAYVWERSHDKLAITSVAVKPVHELVGCDGTAEIVGTINTNGHGGPISYEWIRSTDRTRQVLQATGPGGGNTVQVKLNWAFHGKGTGSAVATLQVLTPNQVKASITFPYDCPS